MTGKVSQRNFATKILPNIRVNFLVRFASKPLFYGVMTCNPLELFRKFFGAVRAMFRLCEPLLLGEGKWGCTKYRRIPNCEGDWKGRVPKSSLLYKKRDFGAPIFRGICPKLLATLLGIHPYLCTPVLPRGQFWLLSKRRKEHSMDQYRSRLKLSENSNLTLSAIGPY